MSTVKDNLARWADLTAATTQGRWHWAGNIDIGEPYLATWQPGLGRVTVLGVGSQERDRNSLAAERVVSAALEFSEVRNPEWFDPQDDEYDQVVAQYQEFREGELDKWAVDEYGEPMRDPRLTLNVDGMLTNARDLAVFEVAPQATTREDPQVYRADITGIRHPDAEFIVAAPQIARATVSFADEVMSHLEGLEVSEDDDPKYRALVAALHMSAERHLATPAQS